nr:hypothetical protein [Streptomyces albidoflavus]
MVVAGGAVTQAAEGILSATTLRAGFVGAVILGVINGLPEAVTSIAAVRRGAIALAFAFAFAFAAIIGGHSLDALNLAVGDFAYRGGSLYHAAGNDEPFLTSAALAMTTVVLGGLLIRQERGWFRPAFDGALLVVIYAATVTILAF